MNEASIVPTKGIKNLELNSDRELDATLGEYSFNLQTIPESHRGKSLNQNMYVFIQLFPYTSPMCKALYESNQFFFKVSSFDFRSIAL